MSGRKIFAQRRYLALLLGLVLTVGNPADGPLAAGHDSAAVCAAAADARPVLATPKSGPRYAAPRVDRAMIDAGLVSPALTDEFDRGLSAFTVHSHVFPTWPTRIVRMHHGPRPPPRARRN